MIIEGPNNESAEEKTEMNSGTESLKKSDTSNDVLMDYEQLAWQQGKPGEKQDQKPHIGLIGGQSKDDEGGIDINKFTGPESQISTGFDDPQAPYHTGPGNGLKNGQNKS